ncbi:MAG: precorrin-4 C(11)-methyltransferase [Oscillospiraceae bacterium]|nr:precorrin-4 C(11)-methyltransferase [Oscillospiraceae bacterium]
MVDFVGAGSGAVDLITVRGQRLLENAQCVIYTGSLINKELLSVCPEDCRLIDSSRLSLDEVIGIINENEQQGTDTVRLHTGDPSLYGAIREQIDRLREMGIQIRITPGVSSFCAAAAALETEYTLPGVSQTVIITRMEGRTAVPPRESISSLAAHHATMVIFLSAFDTRRLQDELEAGGYPPETPAAVVYKVTHPDERIIRCTVGKLHETAQSEGITRTALFVIGDFLGSDYELSKLYDSGFETGYRNKNTTGGGQQGCT